MPKKSNPYFDDFITMSKFSCEAAEYLQSVLSDFKPEALPECRDKMHKIEHAEDEVKHDIMHKLAKEFITPIDREDIVQMASVLDDVTDTIDDILIRMYIYNVKSVRPAALEFADVIVRCCNALHKSMREFPNFHKSTAIAQDIINVNSMEEEGDAIYINAVKELYEGDMNPLEVIAWSELFDRLEDCCDACEHVADMMDSIILKNS